MILSCSFSSMKYPGRAPDDAVLMRVFVGGACQSGLLRLPKAELIELADRELRELLQIQGRSMLQEITLQTRSMPQYHVGHCQRIENIERQLRPYPTLALAGNSLNGVGVPGCIESGEKAAARVLDGMRAADPSRHEVVCL
jgi:oxygen-dependent protoporphyrinogen oxidase